MSAVLTRPARGRPAITGAARSTAVLWLGGLIVILATVAAGAGLFWPGGGGVTDFTTVHGETVTLFGEGLYRQNTRFAGAGNRGADAVTLAAAVPLLVFALYQYGRGSLRGGLLLLGTLPWFLYVYASIALGTAYNGLFLLYIALFSASLFAFVLTLVDLNRQAAAALSTARLPRGPVALFMFASGLVTLAVWLIPLAGAMLRDEPPARLDSSATVVTDVLDLGTITPATFIAGALILRRASLGYLIAISLLVLEVLLAPMIAAQTAFQLAAGISFTAGEMIGPMAGFAILAGCAFWALVALFKRVPDQSRMPDPQPNR